MGCTRRLAVFRTHSMSRVLRSALVHVVLLLAAGAVTCRHGPRLLSQGRQEQDLLRRLRQSPPSLNPSPVISHPRPRCSRVLPPAHHHITDVRLCAVQRLPAVHKPCRIFIITVVHVSLCNYVHSCMLEHGVHDVDEEGVEDVDCKDARIFNSFL